MIQEIIFIMHNLPCKRLLLMPFLLAIFMSGFAQGDRALRFDRITTENIISEKGLSQNSGYCILQDSRGFMWFGTWDGLNKYDGYDFTVYNKESGLSNTTINTDIRIRLLINTPCIILLVLFYAKNNIKFI